jgi:transposase-like protein
MIKSYAVRKVFMKNPDAEVSEVAKKFDIYPTDAYNLRKQVEKAKDPSSGYELLPNGRLIKKARATFTPTASALAKKIGRPRKVDIEASLDKVLNKFVEKFNMDYKHAYALELLVKGDVKKADQVLAG